VAHGLIPLISTHYTRGSNTLLLNKATVSGDWTIGNNSCENISNFSSLFT
jgi:hypothetical protein